MRQGQLATHVQRRNAGLCFPGFNFLTCVFDRSTQGSGINPTHGNDEGVSFLLSGSAIEYVYNSKNPLVHQQPHNLVPTLPQHCVCTPVHVQV